MSSAFYVPEGGEFVSSELTRGPWDPGSQHAGPPAALIARELERMPWGRPGTPGREAEDVAGVVPFIGRITFEVVRPVPIAPLRVETEVVRPGRSVELLAATLLDREGTALIRASAWRLAEQPTELPAGLLRPTAPPGPAEAEEKPFFDTGWDVGYHTAMEYRFVSGSFLEPGPATVWMRMRHPLVAGEQPSALQRVFAAADTGNGASATLDMERYIFINVDLSVHLHRLPVGEWVCLDAITLPEPNGVGLADTALYDERGPVGRALQTLLVRER